MLEGHPAEVIDTYAKQHGADLMLPSHGYGIPPASSESCAPWT
jgi:hypothetical protein